MFRCDKIVRFLAPLDFDAGRSPPSQPRDTLIKFSRRVYFACHFTAKKLNKLKPARRPDQVTRMKSKKRKRRKTRFASLASLGEARKDKGGRHHEPATPGMRGSDKKANFASRQEKAEVNQFSPPVLHKKQQLFLRRQDQEHGSLTRADLCRTEQNRFVSKKITQNNTPPKTTKTTNTLPVQAFSALKPSVSEAEPHGSFCDVIQKASICYTRGNAEYGKSL